VANQLEHQDTTRTRGSTGYNRKFCRDNTPTRVFNRCILPSVIKSLEYSCDVVSITKDSRDFNFACTKKPGFPQAFSQLRIGLHPVAFEMFPAIYRTSFCWLERNLRWLATCCAYCVEHRAITTAESCSAACALSFHFPEAVIAIDWSVSRWLEWNLRFISALGTGSVKHWTI